MVYDALGAHAHDEVLLVTAAPPGTGLIPLVAGTSLMFLALLGGLAARAGGAGVAIGATRVTFWGPLAMALTAGIGWLFRTVV
jgi:hypothetical protein